jgi:hypothetical protein
MKEKIKTFFDSKWFNTIASILSIYVLADYVVEIKETGQFKIMLIVWLVIAYHFISVSYKAWKKVNTN